MVSSINLDDEVKTAPFVDIMVCLCHAVLHFPMHCELLDGEFDEFSCLKSNLHACLIDFVVCVSVHCCLFLYTTCIWIFSW